MKNLAIAVSVLLSTLACLCQTSPQYASCTGKAKAQPELNDCARQEADRVDAKLNQLYQQVLAKAGKDANAVAKIKAAERAWIVYRDAYVEATYPAKDPGLEYGSGYLSDAALLEATLTQKHLADLEDLLKQY